MARQARHSREEIVEAAIALLDREGIAGMTLRGLAAELGGGLGSVYWYVSGKAELLELAGDELVGRALARAEGVSPAPGGEGPAALDGPIGEPPVEVDLGTDDPVLLAAARRVRRLGLALFDAMDAHPWLAAQTRLSGGDRPHGLRVWEHLGRPLAEMGLSRRQQFNGSTALTGFVIGVAAEATGQDPRSAGTDPALPKPDQLAQVVERWQDPAYNGLPWIRSVADEFAVHDDRTQFAAGLDLILVGLLAQARARRG